MIVQETPFAIAVVVVATLLFLLAGVWLEIRLARGKHPGLGAILPALTLLLSVGGLLSESYEIASAGEGIALFLRANTFTLVFLIAWLLAWWKKKK